MSEITERTSVFERDNSKTWLVKQRWKTTETSQPCGYTDLVNFSFLLLKYAECTICFVFIGQQKNASSCTFMQMLRATQRLFHHIYPHPQPSPFSLVSLTNPSTASAGKEFCSIVTISPSFHQLAPPYLSDLLHISTTSRSLRSSSSIHLAVPLSCLSSKLSAMLLPTLEPSHQTYWHRLLPSVQILTQNLKLAYLL